MRGMSKELVKAEIEMILADMNQPWQVAERLERKGFDQGDFAFNMLQQMQQQFEHLQAQIDRLLS